jgi:hypothetical protein
MKALIYIFTSLAIFFIINFIVLRNSRELKEYKINEYLKLKLEGDRTYIYVKNKRFRQCMYLLMNVQLDKVEKYDMINSIDEAAENLDRSMERDISIRRQITPQVEFWGHCSNIEAWAENDYDTRLLHRNLAFPLLRELMLAGDPIAKRVFKEEIAIRITSKHPTVINYLLEEGYLKYLENNELETIFDDLDIPIITQTINSLNNILDSIQGPSEREILNLLNRFFEKIGINHIPFIFSKIGKLISSHHQENIVQLIYEKYKSRKGFSEIEFINENLEYFNLEENDFIKYNNKVIGIIQEEEKLILKDKKIEEITKLKGLTNYYEKIKNLDLSNNLIKTLRGIEKFTNLQILKLDNNLIRTVGALKNLKELELISLKNNNISWIEDIEDLEKLKTIDLSGNKQIIEIPEILTCLPALEEVKLWNCNIKKFTEATSHIFWNNQNYRFFRGYNHEDIDYYENTHRAKALSHVDNGLYKKFVEWVIKMRKKMKKFHFSYDDIKSYNLHCPSLNAIWSGRLTNAFKRWLDFNKNQRKITEFFNK